MPVPLGDGVLEHDLQAEAVGDRSSRLASPGEWAGVQRVERCLGGEVVGEVPGLGVPVLRQLRICGTDVQLAPDRQGMADEEQFHVGLVTTCRRPLARRAPLRPQPSSTRPTGSALPRATARRTGDTSDWSFPHVVVYVEPRDPPRKSSEVALSAADLAELDDR